MDFANEESPHKNVKKWCFYEDYGVLQKIFQKIHVVNMAACLSQALWRFDSIELKEVTKVLQLCCS